MMSSGQGNNSPLSRSVERSALWLAGATSEAWRCPVCDAVGRDEDLTGPHTPAHGNCGRSTDIVARPECVLLMGQCDSPLGQTREPQFAYDGRYASGRRRARRRGYRLGQARSCLSHAAQALNLCRIPRRRRGRAANSGRRYPPRAQGCPTTRVVAGVMAQESPVSAGAR
jgi:hypothetical protein